MRRIAEVLFGKIKRNNFCNNSEIHVTILTSNATHKVAVEPLKNTIFLDVSPGKGKSASKYNNYFCFISKNTPSG